MSLEKNELIVKLEEISELYAETVAIRSEMDAFTPEDHYERKVHVPHFPGDFSSEEEREIFRDRLDHTLEGAELVLEQAHRKLYAPKEPEKPRLKEFKRIEDGQLENKKKNLGCLSHIAVGVCAFFLLGSIVGTNGGSEGGVSTILILAAVAAAAFGFFKFKEKDTLKQIEAKNAEALLAHNNKQQMIMAEYEKQMKDYESESAKYEAYLQGFLKDYNAWRTIYIQQVAEETQISKKLEADRKAAVEKIRSERFVPAEAKLNEHNDLVSKKYLPALDTIIDLIKGGRADDLKEAVNLYEDIVYRAKQLQLQKEREEQRRYEEELRRQDEERRHQEEMKLREAQEYNRQREEEQRRQDEERRHQEDLRARKAEASRLEYQERERIRKEQYKEHMSRVEQENKQWQAAKAQCRACAHAVHCNMSIHNKTPNCTGFTPRR